MSSETHIKEYKFDDKELMSELEAKNKEVEKGRKLNRKIQEFQNQLNQVGHKVQQYKDKIVPMFNERIKPQIELGEFEEVTQVEKKNGKVVVTVVDRIEEYKKMYREDKKKQEDNQDDTDVKQDEND